MWSLKHVVAEHVTMNGSVIVLAFYFFFYAQEGLSCHPWWHVLFHEEHKKYKCFSSPLFLGVPRGRFRGPRRRQRRREHPRGEEGHVGEGDAARQAGLHQTDESL